MKAFKSSLQSLRTLREQQEQDALQNYGKTLQAQEQARNRLDDVLGELEACWVELQQLLDKGGESSALAKLQAYGVTVERRRLECEYALQVARNNARLAFTKLLAARHARAVVDKLLEAQRRRYQRHCRRQEQKQLDELASRRNTLFTLLHLTREPLWN